MPHEMRLHRDIDVACTADQMLGITIEEEIVGASAGRQRLEYISRNGIPALKRSLQSISDDHATITLDHSAIPKAKSPAMTMAFKAAPAITDAAKVGDKVDFDLKLTGSASEVTAIHSEP